MSEKIICAAVYFNTKTEYLHQPINIKEGFVVAGMRHHNAIYTASILGIGMICPHDMIETGFITTKNRFVDRQEAWEIAERNGQIIERKDQLVGTLFSEDLY